MSATPTKILVGPVDSFSDNSRQLVKWDRRNIAVFSYKGTFYAMDNACYHHGGPLLHGDLEDLDGHPCVVCPWHSYRITLNTGEGLYRALDFKGGDKSPTEVVRSKGCKQRVYPVVVEAGNVYVLADASGPPVESDVYSTMDLANREQTTAGPVHAGLGPGGGPRYPLHSDVRSGQVLRHLHHPGRNPLMPPGMVTQEELMASTPGSIIVSCARVLLVTKTVKEFVFSKVDGRLTRTAELGQYVELQLPVKDPVTGKDAVRKWTIVEVHRNGGLFSILVKLGRGVGSRWLHECALFKPVTLLAIRGTFTLSHHAHAVAQCGGNVMMLSAGIAITSMYASLNACFSDPFQLNSSDTLRIVHLHVDRSRDSVVRLAALLRWSNALRGPAAAQCRKTYDIELFLTQPRTETMQSNSGGDSKAAADGTNATGLPRKSFKGDSDSPFPGMPRTTFGRRLQAQDVMVAARAHFPDSSFFAMVCGPPTFVNDMTSALLSLGVPEANIATDDV